MSRRAIRVDARYHGRAVHQAGVMLSGRVAGYSHAHGMGGAGANGCSKDGRPLQVVDAGGGRGQIAGGCRCDSGPSYGVTANGVAIPVDALGQFTYAQVGAVMIINDCEGKVITITVTALMSQDTAFVCSGDTGNNALFAGRFLGKWPLQTNFAASAGFDPVTMVAVTPADATFRTYGGKLCVSNPSGVRSTDLRITPALPWRSQAWTISVMGYTPSGFGNTDISAKLASNTACFRDSVKVGASVFGTLRASSLMSQQYNDWRHYAMAFDGRTGALTTRVYFDGALVSSGITTQTCTQVTQPFLQVYTDGAGNPVAAYRNLRIYSKALSDAEIADIAAEDAA